MIHNPVFNLEILSRLRGRGKRSAYLPGAIALGLLVMWVYFSVIKWVVEDPALAGTAWSVVASILFMFAFLIGPSAAANAISREREQQTWEMLISSRLTPFEIVAGKLAARTLPLAVLSITFIPLCMFCVFVGSGTSSAAGHPGIVRLTLSYAVILASTVLFTMCGLYASWRLSRTIYAIMASYTVVIGLLTIATAWVSDGLQVVRPGTAYSDWIMCLNPISIFTQAMQAEYSSAAEIHSVAGLCAYTVLSLLLLLHMVVGLRMRPVS